ncbi:MAG: hypothetical protein ISS63_10720 [Desulfobacteraceae bacterium]|nr:hypothetical protein [Desulfobacteraceae bacterium]
MMKKLSTNEKYSADELAKELGLSTVIENSIRNNFGDPISIRELKQITSSQFLACKNMGRKRWYELQDALSGFEFPECSVTFIRKQSPKRIIIEVDLSKPFEKVIRDLAVIIDKTS